MSPAPPFTRTAVASVAALVAAVTDGCLDWSRFHGPADAACTMSDAAPDYCASIPALAAPPTLDGVLECGLSLQRFTADDYYATTGPLPPGASASFAVAWRPDGVYVFAQVSGTNNDPAAPSEYSYCGDDLEVFVDQDGAYTMPPSYDTDGTRQFVIVAPPRNAAMGTRADIYRDRAPLAPWTAPRWIATRDGDTVRFEAFVTAADLGLTAAGAWTPMASRRIGFDLGVTLGTGEASDAGSCHHVLGHFVLRIAHGDAGCDQPSCNPVAFCSPTLAP